jgi:two-component system, NarL family, sensor kinase
MAERRTTPVYQPVDRRRAPLKANEATGGKATPSRRVPARTRRRALEAFIGSQQAVVLKVDSAGIVQAAVAGQSKTACSAAAILVGHSLADIFEAGIFLHLAQTCRRSQASGQAQEFGCLLRSFSGPHWFAATVDLIDARGNVPLFFHILLQNASQRRRMRLELLESNSLGDHAMHFAQVGVWEADLGAGRFRCSTRLLEMLCDRGGQAVRPEDLLWIAIFGCFADVTSARDGREIQAKEQNIELPSSCGEPRMLRTRTAYALETTGLPSRFAGVVQDITEELSDKLRLSKSEALWVQAERAANLGRWEMDVRTGKSVWSRALCELLGFASPDGSNERTYLRNVPDEDKTRAQATLADALHHQKKCAYVTRYRSPSGEWKIHQTHAVPIGSAHGQTAWMVGLVQDITKKTRSEEELHRVSQKLMRARDLERRHLARELHESAGQSLAALKMTLGNLREALPRKNRQTVALLDNCFELADEVVREVRTVSYLMHPPMLDEAGLAPALRWYVRGFSDRSKIQVTLDIPEDFGRLPEGIETTTFRLVQEALTNVHRYSGSRTARIRLSRENGYVRLEVKDDGCGLTRPAESYLTEDAGVGIPGMHERVRDLNGVLEIESAPGRGTTIRAVLPDSLQSAGVREPMPPGEGEIRASEDN